MVDDQAIGGDGGDDQDIHAVGDDATCNYRDYSLPQL